VATQIRVTHDSLQQVLAKMRNTPVDSKQFSHPDFIWAAQKFNEKAEAAMVEFENVLKNDVLSKVDFFIKRLDAIRNSTAYSSSQKDEIYRNQLSITRMELTKYESIYQNAILRLYSTGLPEVRGTVEGRGDLCSYSHNLFFHIDFPYLNVSMNEKVNAILLRETCEREDEVKKFPIESYFYDSRYLSSELNQKLMETIVSNSVLRFCWSATCASLLSDLRKNFVKLVANDLHKDIRFGLMDPNDKHIEIGLLVHPRRSTDDQSDPFIYSYDTLIKRFDVSINHTIPLPFDISESDFARAQKERIESENKMRQERMSEIKSALTTKPFWGLADWECKAEDIRKGKGWLCENTYLECMTKEEKAEIVKAVENEFSDASDRTARMKCLEER
jgi:hypothetical protein